MIYYLTKEEIEQINLEMGMNKNSQETKLPVGNHICKWILYQGLKEVYEFCEICDIKREISK